MRILILDNSIDRDCWGAPEYRALIPREAEATVTVRRGPHGDLPASPRGFDRVLATGSRTSCLSDAPWVEREIGLIRATLEAGIPFLGVCFGHQLLVRALGGRERLRRSERGEHGWVEVERLADSPIFPGLPMKFWSFGSHDEEAGSLPPDLRATARSERCGIQAVEAVGKAAWGVQFHPEKNLEEAAKAFAELRAKKGEALHAKRSRELYDPAVGAAIVRGWLG